MNYDYPLDEWRLLDSGARDGATNMAIDEAILEAVTPTLRFYAWDPPCLSLGFSQSARDVDREACSDRGWQIVRRPTGGQAILHVDEFTYSVCAPQGEARVAGGIVESYGRLVAGLLAGLELLGLESARAESAHAQQEGSGPACFAGPARYEVTVDGRKLVGSAQSRRLGGVLQHGTLPLKGDIGRILDGLAFNDSGERLAERSHFNDRALTLETALGRRVEYAQVAEAMAAGFAQALNLKLVPGDLTSDEWTAVRRIRAEKYANDEWTLKT
jgi:lipoate-protein ligase A